jgi:hypothetical protein
MARTIAKDHEAKREAILKTAAVSLPNRALTGPRWLSWRMHAVSPRRLIYHYYPSKDALLFDILDTHLTALVEVVETTAAAARDRRRSGFVR